MSETIEPVVPGWFIWDPWPVEDGCGGIAIIDGEELWLALSAPNGRSRDDRHDVARIRLLGRSAGRWRDHGNLMPDGFSMGTREWSGFASFDHAARKLTLFYTAAGRWGETPITFEQRIFGATAELAAGKRTFSDWRDHHELFVADGAIYLPAVDRVARPGFLTAFRDPYSFVDRAVNEPALIFAASSAATSDRFNGAVGLARLRDGAWHLEPPLVTAIGINTELERPHIVQRAGLYYLFWSTQAHTFAPGVAGVTGLYGMASDALQGPYLPLNGSGLVLANPDKRPSQTYAWQVLGDLRVASFVDIVSTAREPRFIGTIAPMLRVELNGLEARLVPGWLE